MSDQEPEQDFTPWTAEGAARLRTAARELTAAIAAHAETVAAVTSRVGIDEVFAASNRLLPAVLAYADAQFDYTGNGFPFGVLHDYAEDDNELDDEADEDEPEPSAGISVLQRHDYRVTDEAAVMSAGRAAYLRVWAEDNEDAAAADVRSLGRALYQIAHADGWSSLDQVVGLRPTGGCVRVLGRDDTLGPDPEEWPEEELFDDEDAEHLYEQRDVFRG